MASPSSIIANARALLGANRRSEAVVLLQQRVRLHPRDAEAGALLGFALAAQADLERAGFLVQRAKELAPDSPRVLECFAAVQAMAGRPADAIAAYRRVLALAPDNLNAIEGLSMLLALDQAHDEVAALAARGLRLLPNDGPFTALLSGTKQAFGRADDGLALLDAALTTAPADFALLHARACAMNYAEGLNPGAIAGAHLEYGAAVEARAGAPMAPPGPRAPGPLRVGFLSPDLRAHSCAYFVEPLVRHLDRSRFTAIAFSNNAAADRVTEHLRGTFDAWHGVHGLQDRAAADLVRAQDVDILIDLCGLMAGERLGVMALRPARVHATYLGYPNTTGVRRIDYRIIDGITDPPGFEMRCAERLARLDGCFVCFGPINQQAPEPVERNPARDGVVFGSFNILSKVTQPVVELWTRIVNSVPGSKLLLKASVLAREAGRAEVAARFAAAGLAPERLELLGWVNTDPLRMYERIDIGLDPFPYNGTTTTCEALWMGVPVVTLEGGTHAGRVGASLLRHAGLGELVGADHDDYARIAAQLAADPERLAGYRRTLRGRLQGTIMDGAAFARRFEAALERMWSEAGQR